jgi:hypothetical protein
VALESKQIPELDGTPRGISTKRTTRRALLSSCQEWFSSCRVQEPIEAPDLENLGVVLDTRLRNYVDRGSPADERVLAERCAFEHEARRYLTRTQERGYAYQMHFPKAAEPLGRLRQPEQGRREQHRSSERAPLL